MSSSVSCHVRDEGPGNLPTTDIFSTLLTPCSRLEFFSDSAGLTKGRRLKQTVHVSE